MGVGMRKDFENPMSMVVDIRMTFNSEYECRYNSTLPPSILVYMECVASNSLAQRYVY